MPGVARQSAWESAQIQLAEAVKHLGLDDSTHQLPATPAPDVGTDEQTMAWSMDTYSQNKGYTVTGVVTGKPLAVGGSQGRGGATSRGVMYTAFSALKAAGVAPKDCSVAVQGFGKVGG